MQLRTGEGAWAAALELVEEGRTIQRDRGEGGAQDAIDVYLRALEQDPECTAALWELGWSYQVIHELDKAVQVWDQLKTCYDPEIPVDIYELGLIYKIENDPSGSVVITMTLTSPMCPVAGSLPIEVENKVAAIDGVTRAKVELVWDPPWDPDKMTEASRLALGML